MAFPIIVPRFCDCSGGISYRRTPPEKRDCYAYYKRPGFRIKLYYEKLNEVSAYTSHGGYDDWELYAIEQDLITEEIEINPVTKQPKYTGRIW